MCIRKIFVYNLLCCLSHQYSFQIISESHTRLSENISGIFVCTWLGNISLFRVGEKWPLHCWPHKLQFNLSRYLLNRVLIGREKLSVILTTVATQQQNTLSESHHFISLPQYPIKKISGCYKFEGWHGARYQGNI